MANVYTSNGTTSATLVLPGVGFDTSDVGRTVTLLLAPPFDGFSGEYRVTSVTDANTVVTTPGPSGTADATANWTAYVNNAGETNVIADATVQWSSYLTLHAAIAIRESRQQDASDLAAKLQALRARVTSAVTSRAEEPEQPPLTRGVGGWLDDDWMV